MSIRDLKRVSEQRLKREVGFSLLIICRAWRHLLCLTQSFTTTNSWQIITESCWNFMWPQTPSRHFCLLDFFLFECLGATLWHICPDCFSAGVLVVSTSVVFRSRGLNVAGRRGWTLLSPIQQSQEICLTLFTERETDRQSTLFFPLSVEGASLRGNERAIRVYSERSVCLSSAYITWSFLWMW